MINIEKETQEFKTEVKLECKILVRDLYINNNSADIYFHLGNLQYKTWELEDKLEKLENEKLIQECNIKLTKYKYMIACMEEEIENLRKVSYETTRH